MYINFYLAHGIIIDKYLDGVNPPNIYMNTAVFLYYLHTDHLALPGIISTKLLRVIQVLCNAIFLESGPSPTTS